MRTPSWKHWVGASAVVIALVSSGCGDDGDGGGASGTSSLSGNVSNASSTALREETGSLWASLRGFVLPVRSAFAGRSGIRIEVAGAETTTDALGFFRITGLPGGTLTITFENESGTEFELQVQVPEDGGLVLRDVLLDIENGEARVSVREEEVELRGTLVGVSCNTSPPTVSVAAGGQEFSLELGPGTEIELDGEETDCADIEGSVGEDVEAEAERNDGGSLIAQEVEVRPEDDNEEENEAEFEGLVTDTSGCPDTVTVDRDDGEPITVNLTAETEIEGVESCSALQDREVEVEGTSQDGSVTAEEIEVEEEEEEDEDD